MRPAILHIAPTATLASPCTLTLTKSVLLLGNSKRADTPCWNERTSPREAVWAKTSVGVQACPTRLLSVRRHERAEVRPGEDRHRHT
jgi:hypothetical protein